MSTFKYTFEVIIDAESYEDSEQEARSIQAMIYCGTDSNVVNVEVCFEDGGEY